MMRLGAAGRTRALWIREDSPLRHCDPRTRLALSLGASLAVMFPLSRLALFMLLYAVLLAWARLLPEAGRQVWRIKWVLLGLFLLDWWIVGPELALAVTMRLTLLTGAFALFFATTSPTELRLALEWLRVPYRYAFSLGLAFSSVGLFDMEWRLIREAQQSRGVWSPPTGWRAFVARLRDLVALTVPAVVWSAKRAWAINEAAHARGFDSPRRRSYGRLSMGTQDWLLLALSLIVLLALRFL